jgi:CRP-like cAMP-binding protein
MKRTFEAAKDNPLFRGIAFSDFERMLDCLSARTVVYEKNDVILLSGDAVSFVGLILSGNLKVFKEDIDGNRTIIADLTASELFGETLACAGVTHSPVTISASEHTEILLIDYKRVVTSCTAACPFHARLIANMLTLLARKNLMLNQKIDVLSRRTTREKLLCFFDMQRGCASTAALCLPSYARCVTRACSALRKTRLSFCSGKLKRYAL